MASDFQCSPPLSFPVGDVVKQGYLFVKRPPRKYLSKIKAWHKRYFVLRDETQDRSPCLEMYEKDELFTAPLGIAGPKLILDLGQCVHIGFTSDSSRFPYALVIVCQGRSPLILAAEDELSARSWLLALGLITHKGNSTQCQKTSFIPPPSLLLERRTHRNKAAYRDTCSLPQESSAPLSVESTAATLLPEEYNDNDMDLSFAREIFHVSVNPTEDSQRLGMSGDLQLAIFSHGVGLAKPGMASCFVVWPVAYIRQYLHESTGSTGRTKTTIVSLEVGRRSITGEGVFQFRTQKGTEIIRELKGIVELWSARKAVLSIQQSSAKHSFFKTSPTKITHSKGRSWNFIGRSAPCTPSLAFPHTWHQRRSSPGPSKKSAPDITRTSNTYEIGKSPKHSESADAEHPINYIVPCFEGSPPSEKTNQSKSPCVSNKKSVTADVGKDGCVRTKHTRIMGACSIPEVQSVRMDACSGESSDECCYVEVDPTDAPQPPPSPLMGTPMPSPAKIGISTCSHEPEGYLEVIPT
ncbi:insulin receptor substrate 1 isoform X2 [Parasteatoda tepidariorum]|uniref:insulin receptor substrate 1 isoform X2 n=1 Tax=Parasteatoda tepidariorum TaxID=114398 RepID=UPI00077FAF78|nr:uncharacterized protein LOC107451933 isoform X2 [Parasteatoda tepidariorum]